MRALRSQPLVLGVLALGALAGVVALGLRLIKPTKCTFAMKARADFDAFRKALALYERDNGHLPGKLSDLWEQPSGVPGWRGPYVEGSVEGNVLDPWGNSYVYTPPREGSSYEIIPYGSDGVPGGIDDAQDLTLENVDAIVRDQ